MGFSIAQHPYRALRDIVAERTRPILAWVGSGASVGAGLPTWTSLRQQLIGGLYDKAELIEPPERERLRAAAARAEAETSPWVAFNILEGSLGRTSFRDLIREPFAPIERTPTPSIYNDLWRLRIKGMLTLNLDRLAARSMGESIPGHTLVELSGSAVDRLRTNLSGPRPIVANLHGTIEDTDSWILTHKQLTSLGKREGYKSFIQTCLSMFTIIFVGISVDDIAVGGHLDHMRKLDVELPTHFWITNRQDAAVDRWAEDVGVRIIRYKARGEDHSELNELFDDLKTYVSVDADKVPPVNSIAITLTSTSTDLPPEDQMLSWTSEDIRTALNAHARELLANPSETAYTNYDKFAQEYDQAIYRAWYVNTTVGKNLLLGYELEEHVARGAFGNVYKARSKDGREIAIKILLDEVRQDVQALQSFRRGVQSMRILENRAVEGMASYYEASEIPALVVMEWIDGPNLADAKQAKRLADWHSVLPVAEKLTSIIRSAHMLPERVLHRDIRPPNVMLRDYWLDEAACDVVVLDFDLSWHQGAQERSILHTTSAGYLAPEQLRPNKNVSTRSAFVDSFGIGMTLLFLCGGNDPIPGQHKHTTWRDDVAHACSQLPRPSWRSLPARIARLIIACTRDTQSDRADLSEIQRELRLLIVALGSREPVHPELLVEEVAARSEALNDYAWDDDAAEAIRDAGTGLRIALRADLPRNMIEASVVYASPGSGDRARLNRYLTDTARSLGDQFVAYGWKVTEKEVGYADLAVRATISADVVAKGLDSTVQHIEKLFGNLRIDQV